MNNIGLTLGTATMNTSSQPTNPTSENHANTSWPADIKHPIIGAPVPVGYMFMSAATANMLPEGLMYARAPGFVDPAMAHPNMAAGHFGMVQHHHQPGWSQYPPFMVTPPVTPPNNHPGAVYDVTGRNRAPPQAQVQAQAHAQHGHMAHWSEAQDQLLVNLKNHNNLACLRAQLQAQQQQQAQQQAQQSEQALLAQFQAKLSLQETEKRSSVAATTDPTTATTTTAQPPARTLPIPAPIVAETISTSSTELTIIPAGAGAIAGAGAGASTTAGGAATRTILGPDGNTLVPPPDPSHPGCELSEPMSQALKNFEIGHVCDYMVAKDFLRDKIVNQVLENTKEKLMELLQNELDRMAAEEEDDDDLDFDCEDEEDEETAGQVWGLD